ncbi:hypothetical protein [Myxosarcina sp. GI1]|uniref:hypothetical protein n=1 Tax=Myxosarcina sp. GI1 TaxID=1541065 RepID=UPI0005628CAA|nr:hypothetical protein [Myxosarcina sp. GI1]
MDNKNERDFIKISQVVGKAKVIGPLSFVDVIPLVLVFFVIYGLSLLKIKVFDAILVGTWLLGTIFMVSGTRPDKFMRRLRGKPKRWRRGFYPSKTLIGKKK